MSENNVDLIDTGYNVNVTSSDTEFTSGTFRVRVFNALSTISQLYRGGQFYCNRAVVFSGFLHQ